MKYDTEIIDKTYSRVESMNLNTMKDPTELRLRVISDDVKKCTGITPKEYRNLPNRMCFEDHRVFLCIGRKCIGFMVSPYNLHTERHKALALEGHTVVEIRQQHHINAQTLVVIKDEYIRCIFWRKFKLSPYYKMEEFKWK